MGEKQGEEQPSEAARATEALFAEAAPIVVLELGKRLLALTEAAQRTIYLEERLKHAPALPLVRALACAQRESVLGHLHARVVVETFALACEQGRVEPTLRGALLAGAAILREDVVVTLLSEQGANDSGAPRQDKAKKGSLADLGETLGRRKSLARTATGDLFLKILDDPHPDVVKNALLNPKMTEELAVRVAARRPAPGAVLEVVSRSRFQNRHAVRRALLLNPDCPPALACRLAATMTTQDLQDVLRTPGIAEQVKTAARQLLE